MNFFLGAIVILLISWTIGLVKKVKYLEQNVAYLLVRQRQMYYKCSSILIDKYGPFEASWLVPPDVDPVSAETLKIILFQHASYGTPLFHRRMIGEILLRQGCQYITVTPLEPLIKVNMKFTLPGSANMEITLGILRNPP